jgi:hypothetical protein
MLRQGSDAFFCGTHHFMMRLIPFSAYKIQLYFPYCFQLRENKSSSAHASLKHETNFSKIPLLHNLQVLQKFIVRKSILVELAHGNLAGCCSEWRYMETSLLDF